MSEPIRSKAVMREALAQLSARDADIARAWREVGDPPLRRRDGGFASLVRSIIAQQVSAAAGRAITARLEAAAEPLTPERFLALGDADLRRIGFSRQKAAYGRALAIAVLDGALNFRRIARLDDETAIEELVRIKGIGRWTAEVHLLFALRRPDIWPVDDLAVVVAVKNLKGLSARPGRKEMLAIAEPWRPWRSVAARLMWHYYRNAPA